MKTTEFFELFHGTEMWTNALGDRFGERVCVGFDKDKKMLVSDGVWFKPTKKEIQAIYDEYWKEGDGKYLSQEAEQEFGGVN